MNLTDGDILKFQRGTPYIFEDVCAIYSVTMGQIADIGYENFQQYLGLLTSNKPMVRENDTSEMAQVLKEVTDFQYILLMTALDQQMNEVARNAFRFFTHEEVLFSLDPAQIIIGPAEEQHILNEENFYNFQTVLRRMYFLEQEGEEIIIYPNDSPEVKQLKQRMRDNREKLKRAKAKQAAQEGSDLKLSDLIGSITINNCGLNMENIWNITYYAFHDQLRRMGWRDQFNINNQAALAGAKLDKKQLKHWMRSIASSE